MKGVARVQFRPSLIATCALCFAALAACSIEPDYLGIVDGETTPQVDEPIPFSCEDLCFIDPSLTEDDASQLFDEPTLPASTVEDPAPTWVYPLPESVHPNNLGLLTLHFYRGMEDQELFELTLGDGDRTRHIYFPCLSAGNDGCTYKVPEDFWIDAASEFAGETIQLHLRAARPGGLSLSTSRSIRFSPEPVLGGLYYWSSELRGLFRLLFGSREAVPFVSPDTDACVGCHAVSRDGGTIAYTMGSADPTGDVFDNAAFDGALRIAPITALGDPSIDPGTTPLGSGMMTLSRQGERVVSAFDYKLELRDAKTGDLLDQVEDFEGKVPFFPEFSPDDQSIVVTLTNEVDSEIAVRGGGLYVVSVAGDAFGEAVELVPEEASHSHYYPSWSPDGKWVAFVSSPGGVKSYDQPQGRLRLVSVETGEVFELEGATGPLNSTSTWPKFAPFSQCEPGTTSCSETPIFFLSYSSKRQYGLVANQPGQFNRSQLWMSALFMGRTKEGNDPSSPPFWVPYQGPDTSNHLGYWTLALRCNDTEDCGPDETCDPSRGECIVRPR